MLNTKEVKKLFYYLIRVINTVAIGRRICQEFLDAQLSLKSIIKHDDINLEFLTPNLLSYYRATSFSAKEPDTLKWIDGIPGNAIFWDVGANVGLYSIYAAKRGCNHVYSFEPSVFNLELLARNVNLNALNKKITIMPIALSEKIGTSQFKLTTTSWGGALSTFDKDFDQHGNQINSVFEYGTVGLSLDDVAEIFKIPFPNYLKIDVDGLEHLILQGGRLVLKKVDSVLIEISDDFQEQSRESFNLLSSAGLALRAKFSLGGIQSQHNQLWTRLAS